MIEFTIIGLYRIVPTMESIIQAVRYHKYNWLLDEHGKYVDKIFWDNHKNLGLLETQIRGVFAPNEVLRTISLNQQAPYMEFYLDPTGHFLLNKADAIGTEDRRVCFFLHFVDTAMPLRVDQVKLKLPPWSELPERLEPFTHYLPVD